ncbi:hypothetical protein [Mitsuaria sp. 7]|uniref:hypothetical protein n=1 Tax=Mitsuaria sp. 7 TaxID=1658665 RepID=UPI0007DE2CC5|nr:hypothetical protein [Mitsuaria sp. 7]ANH67379.1 hypothetical protein ABE85_06990 [Mitsuaria sp. 7]
MTTPIVANAPTTPAAATGPTDMQQMESMMAQRMMMSVQQGQQAMSKSMTKVSDQIKASMQDDE